MYNTKYTRKIRDELKKTQIKNINSLNRNNFINEDLKSHSERPEYKNIFQSMNENKLYKEQVPRMSGGKIQNMEMAEDLQRQKIMSSLNGGSFWKDFKRGFKKGFTAVTKPAASIMSVIPPFMPAGAVLHGINKVVEGAGSKQKRRADKVKEIMRAKNLSMIEASKYIKTHNIEY